MAETPDLATLAAHVEELREGLNAQSRAEGIAFSMLVRCCAASGAVKPSDVIANLEKAEQELRRHNEHAVGLQYLQRLAKSVREFCADMEPGGAAEP
ncbi:hypothetical protein [Methylorubrum extorquens]|uniref:hypothetical protein n=1 Tax=Methylorubrum extorquens TaxID=408 RepID=UPI0022376947|nr:hypothetical protein [Methylorubrum extorquens]UYW34445.1 hypothetical protein OKB92_10305 [Methylorubrum extorquens]